MIFLSVDIVQCNVPLLIGRKTMKSLQLVIDTVNDNALMTLNGEKKQIELYTSASGHWCFHVQPDFPLDAINVLFTVQGLSLQFCAQYASIFRLLLKVAVSVTHQCAFSNFCKASCLYA